VNPILSKTPANALQTATIRRVIQAAGIYGHWSGALVDALCEAGQQVTLAKGESRVFSRHNPPMVYLLESGVLEVVIILANGREQALGYLHPGAFCGLHQSMTLMPHEETHEYLAQSDVVAWRFTPDNFKALMRSFPPLAETIAAIMATRLSLLADAVANNALLRVEARVASSLLNSIRAAELKVMLAQSSSESWDMTQAQLARMLGLTRQSVGATLREFERQGLITMRRQKIELLNPTALREIVNGVAASSVS
jgi:CRP-like cAMP-binding protein